MQIFQVQGKNYKKQSANYNTLDTEFVVPLKYLSSFWRSLDLPSVKCEIELKYLKYEISNFSNINNKTNNLDYMIDLTFTNINKLFVVSFKMVPMIQQRILLRSITRR